MKSFAVPSFWQAYDRLPSQMQEQANKAFELWQKNLFHPSLHFKKVGKNLWSVRISEEYRAVALKKGEDYYWIWIGDHKGYESLLGNF